MPRRARHLFPTQLPRRGEVLAAFAVLVLLAHLLFAQLAFVLAVVFAAVSKTTRWRLWWLAVPAVAGLAWTLAIGPTIAAAGFAAGPVQVLGYLSGGHLADRLLHPHGAFAGVGGWLPRQFPLALIAAAAEAALAGWLDWMHTDEWAVRPRRPGVLAAVRGALGRRAIRAGLVVTRDGCVLGVAPDNGARVTLRWSEIAGGALVTGADTRTLAVSSLQMAHAALRRRKPLIALDLTGDGALASVLGAACAATGTPLRAAGEAQDGHWLGHEPEVTALARVVRQRSAALISLRTPDVAAQVCTGVLALGEDLRRIGADGDGLVWLYGYVPQPDGPLAELVGSLVARGGAVGLPVLVTTTSPQAVADLAGRVSAVLMHRPADPAMAAMLAARTGTKLVPAGLAAGEWTTTVPPVATVPSAVHFSQTGSGMAMHPGTARSPAAAVPTATAMGQAGFCQPPVAMPSCVVIQSGVGMPPGVTVQPGVTAQPSSSIQSSPAIQPGAGMPFVAAMPPAVSVAQSAAGLVPVPAVPARTLLSLGPAEFVLAVSSPRCRLVKLGRAVPARLPRGAAL